MNKIHSHMTVNKVLKIDHEHKDDLKAFWKDTYAISTNNHHSQEYN